MKNFDAAKYFKTHPALVNRTYNRPKLEALKKGELAPPVDDDSIEASILVTSGYLGLGAKTHKAGGQRSGINTCTIKHHT